MTHIDMSQSDKSYLRDDMTPPHQCIVRRHSSMTHVLQYDSNVGMPLPNKEDSQ